MCQAQILYQRAYKLSDSQRWWNPLQRRSDPPKDGAHNPKSNARRPSTTNVAFTPTPSLAAPSHEPAHILSRSHTTPCAKRQSRAGKKLQVPSFSLHFSFSLRRLQLFWFLAWAEHSPVPCSDDHGSDHVQCAVSHQYMNSWGVVHCRRGAPACLEVLEGRITDLQAGSGGQLQATPGGARIRGPMNIWSWGQRCGHF